MGHWLNRTDDWINKHRPWALLATVVSTLGVVALINWVTDSDLFRQFFFPKPCDSSESGQCDPIEWKDLFQAALLVLGLPVAFMLWHWRDRNVRDQIDNGRKDVNLKEFQEVFKIAAGGFDANLSEQSAATMQIAALHQLRGFLRGEYGSSFKKPAFELLLAGHAQAMSRIQLAANLRDLTSKNPDGFASIAACINSHKQSLSSIDVARISIIRQELKFILNQGYSLTNRCFDLLDLGKSFDGFDHELTLKNVSFRGSSFIGTTAVSLSAIECDFDSCDLYGANFSFSDLCGSRFWNANLNGLDLHESDIRGANFATAQPTELVSCIYASFDEDTWLKPSWWVISSSDREAARRAWLDQDAVFDPVSPDPHGLAYQAAVLP
jgi:Pentapeptide repeats (8 copies)